MCCREMARESSYNKRIAINKLDEYFRADNVEICSLILVMGRAPVEIAV